MRAVLPWIPASLLVLALLAAWGTVALGGGLQAVVAWVLLQAAHPLLGGFVVLLGLAHLIWTKQPKPVHGVTLVVALVALWPLGWGFRVLPIAFPASADLAEDGATVRVPLDGPVQVLWGGDALATNYHAMTPDQRWAYDLGVQPILTGSSDNADYGCWDRVVRAPATARVHVAHDGEPDQTPGQLSMNLAAPLGNHVVLELDAGYLVLAHLREGSVAVEAGQEVGEGAELGRCGNSGNTSEPHVHVHLQVQDPAEFPVGFAEGLPLRFRDHGGPPMPPGGVAEVDGAWVPTGAVVEHQGD